MPAINFILDCVVFVFYRVPNYIEKKVGSWIPALWFLWFTLLGISLFLVGNWYTFFAVSDPATFYPHLYRGTFFTLFIAGGFACLGAYSLLKDLSSRKYWWNPFKGAQYNEEVLEDWVCFFFYPCATLFGSVSFISQLFMPSLMYLLVLLSIIGVLTGYVLLGAVSAWRHLT